MKKILFLLLCFGLVIIGLGWIGYRYLQSLPLRSTTLDESGLVWQECEESQGYDWKQAADCFSHSMPLWSDSEKTNFGERVGMEDFRLTSGQNTYKTVLSDSILPIRPCYSL
jgi:hypothetical protein